MAPRKAKILVVDDDAHLLELLVDTLKSIGYETTGAPGGVEALDQLDKEKYDLMISDIKMPGIDGISLLKKVRRHFPRMPVLFITGVATPEMIARSTADGFLAKPFRISHIEELIESTLNSNVNPVARGVRKVMVVDDDPSFRDMLTDALRLNGFVPLGVTGGEEALRELENGEVDAVISDIRMPGMNGVDLLGKLKDRYPELPVVLVTAFLEHKEETLSAGPVPDAFLEKPFQIERMIELLNELGSGPAEN